MRTALFSLLVFVVCLPLACVLLLVAAMHFAAMDRAMVKMPYGVRTVVAAMLMSKADSLGDDAGKWQVNRALLLDPENPDANATSCRTAVNEQKIDALPGCRKALRLQPTRWTLNDVGVALDRDGKPCEAEEYYTRANADANGSSPLFLRNMAGAAFRCGRIPYAIAEASAAEDIDSKDLKKADEEDAAATLRDNLQLDREWLSAAYTADKQTGNASTACVNAHPEFTPKSCACRLDPVSNKIVCTGVKASTPAH